MVMSGREVVGIAVQTAIGTPVNPTIMVPVMPGTFKANEIFEPVLDRGRRGIDAMDFGSQRGVGITEITWEGEVQQGNASEKAPIGYLLDNLLGASSTATQIGATVAYDHRLILGTTKEYLTVEHDSGGITGANDRRFSGFRPHEITVSWNAGEGSLKYSVTGRSRSATGVTAQTLTDNLGDPWMGWQGDGDGSDSAVVFDGNTDFARLVSGEWRFSREVEPFYASSNSRDVSDIYLGPLEVTVDLVLDYSIVTDLAAFRADNQRELSTRWSVGVNDSNLNWRSFGIGAVVVTLSDAPAELDSSGQSVKLGLTGRCLYSTSNGPFSSESGTNAKTAQNGPVQVQIVQEGSAAY
tara:strand:+ start:2963 stop:4021 length:1059 start_codon:yes stop_codon:yes gene_type:complete